MLFKPNVRLLRVVSVVRASCALDGQNRIVTPLLVTFELIFVAQPVRASNFHL